MTWNDLCERADGEAFGSPALKAKDEARWQIRNVILEMGGHDIEKEESPEEEIEIFLFRYPEYNKFDERGNRL